MGESAAQRRRLAWNGHDPETVVYNPDEPRNLKQVPRTGVLDRVMLRDAFETAGINLKHVGNVERHVVKNQVTEWKDIPGLPKKAYTLLEDNFLFTSSVVEKVFTSSDESTTKMLVRLFDGKRVEAVIMRYGTVELASFPEHLQRRDKDGSVEFKSTKRATLCVSSQVGCRMACTFCATGTMGHLANLTSGEILEQLHHANKIERVRNVVFMGMGEPLDNYDEVVEAIRGMRDVRRFNLAGSHISVSTVGIPKRIRQLANEARDITLALSLHGASQEMRCKLLPCARAYPLERILDALDYFTARQRSLNSSSCRNQLILIQYILIKDVNDSEHCAKMLRSLMSSRRDNVMINLIPYNPTDSTSNFESPYETSTQEAVDAFVDVLRTDGLRVTVRQELGQDIGGACGQLVNKKTPVTDAGCALATRTDAEICKHNHEAQVPCASPHILGSLLKDTMQKSNSTVVDDCGDQSTAVPDCDATSDGSVTDGETDYIEAKRTAKGGKANDCDSAAAQGGVVQGHFERVRDALQHKGIRYAAMACFTTCMVGLFVISRARQRRSYSL